MLCRLARFAPSVANICRAVPTKPFSTAVMKPGSIAALEQKIFNVVIDEIEGERSSYSQDKNFKPFLDDSEFTLVDMRDTTQVTLHKQEEDIMVEVTFLPQPPKPLKEGSEDSLNEEEDKENLDKGQVEFQVALRNVNSGSALLFGCSTQEREAAISSLMHTNNLANIDRASVFYTQKEVVGPMFFTLDKNLQIALGRLLLSFGVSDELATFIEAYSADKEQRLYMNWLGEMKEFLS